MDLRTEKEKEKGLLYHIAHRPDKKGTEPP